MGITAWSVRHLGQKFIDILHSTLETLILKLTLFIAKNFNPTLDILTPFMGPGSVHTHVDCVALSNFIIPCSIDFEYSSSFQV